MASVTPSVNARMLSPGSREIWHESDDEPTSGYPEKRSSVTDANAVATPTVKLTVVEWSIRAKAVQSALNGRSDSADGADVVVR